jgi:hypothetical protein
MANYLTPKKRARKGLSPLHRFILSLAWKQSGEVLAREVLIEYFGFSPFRNPEWGRRGATVFRKSDIGLARYNSKTVTVCKAFNRLVDRGLAIRIYSGICLRTGRNTG